MYCAFESMSLSAVLIDAEETKGRAGDKGQGKARDGMASHGAS
jgi:hypothetical protein